MLYTTFDGKPVPHGPASLLPPFECGSVKRELRSVELDALTLTLDPQTVERDPQTVKFGCLRLKRDPQRVELNLSPEGGRQEAGCHATSFSFLA